MNIPLPVLGHLAVWSLAIGGAGALGLLMADPTSFVRRAVSRYVDYCDDQAKFLFEKGQGKSFFRFGLLATFALIARGLLMGDFNDPKMVTMTLALSFAAFAVPVVKLRRKHKKRVLKIEAQLDSWLLVLANGLKATPSLGDAIAASAKIVQEPISQELDFMLKETRVGSSLDIALSAMIDRIGSRVVSGALATILIGRQTGGDLPRILEESAATLREMSRLEGVVRTKTAEGRAQSLVLGAMPFVLLFGIHMVDDQWLVPLANSTEGFIAIMVAGFLWVSAILLARRILQVDI